MTEYFYPSSHRCCECVPRFEAQWQARADAAAKVAAEAVGKVYAEQRFEAQIAEQTRLIVEDLDERIKKGAQRGVDELREHFDDLKRTIREQKRAKAKPAEPQGLGAVVLDRTGNRWVRLEEGLGRDLPWRIEGGLAKRCAYADIDVVRVLSEGFSP